MIVVTKSDLRPDAARVEAIGRFAEQHGVPWIQVSAVAGEGLNRLIGTVRDRLDELPADEEPPE